MEDSADFKDDPAVEDDALLWRRVRPDWVIMDENTGRHRVSTAAFHDGTKPPSPMSTLIERIVRATQRTAEDVLRDYQGYSLCYFSAGLARSLGQLVATKPEEPSEPAHAFIVGPKPHSIQKRLSRASEWVILNPPGS
jgi:hypothetical protein